MIGGNNLTKDRRLSLFIVEDWRRCENAGVGCPQDEIQADTSVISHRGIRCPFINMPGCPILASLFQESDAVNHDRFRRLRDGTGGQRATAGIGVFHHGHLQIFLAQVCARHERQTDTGRVVSAASKDLSFFRIFELELICRVREGQPITRNRRRSRSESWGRTCWRERRRNRDIRNDDIYRNRVVRGRTYSKLSA